MPRPVIPPGAVGLKFWRPDYGDRRVLSAWNNTDKRNLTLSNNDKTASTSAFVSAGVRSTTVYPSGSSGKFYAELAIQSISFYAGIADTTIDANQNGSLKAFAVRETGAVSINGTSSGFPNLGSLSGTNTLCIAWDSDAKLVWFRKNAENWNNSGTANPATGIGGLSVSFAADINHALWYQTGGNSEIVTIRTEVADFTSSVPSGFTSWIGELPSAATVGTAVGVATANAVGESINVVAGDGSAVGLGAATATGVEAPSGVITSGDGTASGTGTANGVGASSPYCPEALQFFDRITGLTEGRKVVYDTYIRALVSSGAWGKLQFHYVFAAPDTATAVTNLISSSFNGTINGSPSFTADEGFSGPSTGATSHYIDTGYNPSVNGSQNNQHISVWNNTNQAENNSVIGCRSGGVLTQITPKYTDNNSYHRVNTAVYHASLAISDPRGLHLATRSGSGSSDNYFNGVAQTAGGASSSPPNYTIYILAENQNGTALDGGTNQLRSASAGTHLSSTEVAAFYTAQVNLWAALAGSVGDADGLGAASATGTGVVAGAGTASGISTATATGRSVAASVGDAAGVGAATGTGTGIKSANASTASGLGTAAATAAATAASVGTAAGIGTATATGGGIGSGVGDADGIGAATATGRATGASAGDADGTGTAAATATATAASVGTASGTGAALALSDPGTTTGETTGQGTAAATGRAITVAVGAATGVGSASATGARTVAGVGAASGTGTAAAVSEEEAGVIAEAVGTASGVGEAIGRALEEQLPIAGGGGGAIGFRPRPRPALIEGVGYAVLPELVGFAIGEVGYRPKLIAGRARGVVALTGHCVCDVGVKGAAYSIARLPLMASAVAAAGSAGQAEINLKICTGVAMGDHDPDEHLIIALMLAA